MKELEGDKTREGKELDLIYMLLECSNLYTRFSE